MLFNIYYIAIMHFCNSTFNGFQCPIFFTRCRYFATHDIQYTNYGTLINQRELLSLHWDKDDCLWHRYWLHFSLLKPNWPVRWCYTFLIGHNFRVYPRGGTCFTMQDCDWLIDWPGTRSHRMIGLNREAQWWNRRAPSGVEMSHKHRCFRNNA